MEAEFVALDKWSLLSKIEEKVLSQRAKLHWLDVGDGNNKTFIEQRKFERSVTLFVRSSV